MKNCIFCRIVEKSAPADIIYEDEEILAFRDAHPQAPVHILLIPKEHYSTLGDAPADLLGKLMRRAALLAETNGLSEKGYRTVVNCGHHGGQSVYHLHVHLLGGRWFSWPPG